MKGPHLYELCVGGLLRGLSSLNYEYCSSSDSVYLDLEKNIDNFLQQNLLSIISTCETNVYNILCFETIFVEKLITLVEWGEPPPTPLPWKIPPT